MTMAGTLKLNKGDALNIYLYSSNDKSYRVQHESGFGCHMMGTRIG